MEIELYRKLNETSPLDAIDRMGQWFASSGMFGCTKAEQGKMLALICVTESMTPVQTKQKYHLMANGQLQMKSHRILSDFRKLGGKHTWIKDGQDGQEAILELVLDGKTIQYKSTIAAAKANGMVKNDSAWQKRPGNMLRADCIRNGVPMLAPEIIGDDIEEDSTATQVAPLFQDAKVTIQTGTGSSVKAEKPKPPVQDAEIIPSSPKVSSTEASAPAREQQPAETAPSASPVPSSPAAGLFTPHTVTLGPDGLIAPESLKQFIARCQTRGNEFEGKAVKWLADQNYTRDGILGTISPERLQRIFNAWDKWVSVVEAVQ